MKKEVILAFIFLGILTIASLGFASAVHNTATTCADDQTILRISSATNAHGEQWNLNNYQERICYDKLFGKAYTGANPHLCLGSAGPFRRPNEVVRLSSGTNAHAQDPDGIYPSGVNYNVDVCYGDLKCFGTAGSCPAGNITVLSLTSDENSHLALGSDANYGYKICCSSAFAGGGCQAGQELCADGTCQTICPLLQVVNANFTSDSAGNNIINRSNVNSTVYLTAKTTEASGTVKFDILESDGPSSNEAIISDISIQVSGGKAVYEWKINDSHIKQGILNGPESDGYWEFYFIVKAVDDSILKTSGMLNTTNLAIVPPTTGAQCIDNGYKVKITRSDGTTETQITFGTGAVKGACSKVSGGCCPTGNSCFNGECVIPTVTQCSDYKSRSECRNDDFDAAESDPLWSATPECGKNGVTCDCAWNATTSSTGFCYLKKEYDVTCTNCGAGTDGRSCQETTCSEITSKIGECFDGVQKYKTTRTVTPATCSAEVKSKGFCADEERTTPCAVGSAIELPFFGFGQFFIASTMIAILYLLMFKFNILRRIEIKEVE